MDVQKDTRFYITSLANKQAHNTHEYKSYKYLIETNGAFTIKHEPEPVAIYTAELAYLLWSKELLVENMDTGREEKLNRHNYLKTYIEAYQKGQQYFEDKFEISPIGLNGAYVKDLANWYANRTILGKYDGWSFVTKNYPVIITHKTIKDYGYYSGVTNKLLEYVNNYSSFFKSFSMIDQEFLQTAEEKSDEVKNKYPHIFKSNAFEVWQSMFDEFQIKESSRTDVKFMFEEMKKDGLIFETVNQKTFLDWISQTYEITIVKTSNHSRSKERISIYSTAKQLYKDLDY